MIDQFHLAYRPQPDCRGRNDGLTVLQPILCDMLSYRLITRKEVILAYPQTR